MRILKNRYKPLGKAEYLRLREMRRGRTRIVMDARVGLRAPATPMTLPELLQLDQSYLELTR